MLRNQYGVAASSSATPVSHAEDAQPNETIYKRRHGQPPQIGSTWRSNYSGIQRGGYSGQWSQRAMRGNSSWRGRGNFSSNRGGHNSNQHPSQAQRSTHHSVPPIATLPDVEYRIPLSSIASSSQIQPSHPPITVIQENRLSRAEPRYMVPVDVPTTSPPTFSGRQLLDDYRWLHRSKSPSPKFPQSALQRRKVESQPTHVSDSRRNQDSHSVKHHSPTAESMLPNSNKPLLPGRHRQIEGSSPVRASPKPLVQVQAKAISPPVSTILAEPSTIKQELRTPSPTHSLRTERSLITSSCKFYPIPEFCKKSHPGFKEIRKAFFKEKMQELTRLGLTKVRSFFRDDGLAIEWKSKVPVWSDTLLPEFPDLASAIKRAHQLNDHTSPKRKRQSVEQQSRESSLQFNNNTNVEQPASKRARYCLEEDDIEIIEPTTMPVRNTSSPTPISSFDHGNCSSTTVVPLLNPSELISFDADVVPHDQHDVLGDTEPLNQPKMSALEVDRTLPPKPVRRMLFKPVLPRRKILPASSSVQNSTPPTSDSTEPLSTNLESVDEGHSKKDPIKVVSQPQDEAPLHTKTSSRLPLPNPRRPPQRHSLPIPQSSRIATQKTSNHGVSKSCTPTSTPPSLPPQEAQVAGEVEVYETRVSPSKEEDYGNATDPDAELVVDLLLPGTPEESHNRLSTNPLPEEMTEVLQLHASEAKDDADDDSAAVEGLATHFLQGYLQLFDVDRLKLEAAYAKNALFSCRVHHVQEPSFSMAGLFAPESATSRPGFNVSLSRASMSAIQQGRAQIVNRLLELGPHRFCPRGVPRNVNYNVVSLSPTTGGGILLAVHGEVVNPHLAGPQMDHVLSVDQSFVLRRRTVEDDDQNEGMDGFGQTISSTAASAQWPLVAVSHQMIVRDVGAVTV